MSEAGCVANDVHHRANFWCFDPKFSLHSHTGLDSRTSLAAFFEVVAGGRGNAPDMNAAPQFFLQFVTKYLHEKGEFRCRVTTVTRTCDPLPVFITCMLQGFVRGFHSASQAGMVACCSDCSRPSRYQYCLGAAG